MFQIVCIYMIIFLRGQTYINIFIVYICPDENSVYFYLSLRSFVCNLNGHDYLLCIGLLQNANAYPPPGLSPKTFSKGLLSNFPVSKRFFFPGIFFSEDKSSFTVVFINCLSIRVFKVLPMTSKRKAIEFVTVSWDSVVLHHSDG